MDDLELYFINDIPICIYGPTCSFPRKSWEKVAYGDSFYYKVPAYSYEAAIEQLQWRANDYATSLQTEEFRKMVIHATGQIIDVDRGDGFTLMMADLSEWVEYLSNYKVPEIYR